MSISETGADGRKLQLATLSSFYSNAINNNNWKERPTASDAKTCSPPGGASLFRWAPAQNSTPGLITKPLASPS